MVAPIKIELMQSLALKRRGKCLSSMYDGLYHKLEWECSDGHRFSQTPSQVKRGVWCPFCQNKYYKENICRKYFEELFGVEFPKIHPKWLDRKELDGYNESLHLGFEYNGQQHYHFSPHYHRRDALLTVQKRDRTKYRLCKKNNVVLITIPYWVSLAQMKNYILHKCKVHKISVPFRNKEIDYKDFDVYSKTYFQKVKQIAKECGYECLSKNYVSSHDKMVFRCNYNHVFTNFPCNIFRSGRVKCSFCAGNNRKNIIDMRRLATLRNGQCVSLVYCGMHKDLIWQCCKGHKWYATPHRVKTLHNWCPFCNGGSNLVKHKILNQGVL